jgi:hypothetical protein
MGLSRYWCRPDWMICSVLAVPPLTVRPSVVMDDNTRMEDDLTHKLITIIQEHNGKVLYVNTDSVSCVFPTSDIVDIKNYYWDQKSKVLKYKFEEKYMDDNFENLMNQYNQLDKKDKKNCNIYDLLYVLPFEIERLPIIKDLININ